MKYLLLSILCALSLQADYVKETTGACAEEETLLELEEYAKTHFLKKGGLEIELWMISHDCKIIDRNTKIEVLDYTGKKTEILKILLKKTGDIVFTNNKNIQIEQPGQDNIIYKF